MTDLDALVNAYLLILLYVATGQAVAHPVFLEYRQQARNERAFAVLLGAQFGLFWPILLPLRMLALLHDRREAARVKAEADAQDEKDDSSKNP